MLPADIRIVPTYYLAVKYISTVISFTAPPHRDFLPVFFLILIIGTTSLM